MRNYQSAPSPNRCSAVVTSLPGGEAEKTARWAPRPCRPSRKTHSGGRATSASSLNLRRMWRRTRQRWAWSEASEGCETGRDWTAASRLRLQSAARSARREKRFFVLRRKHIVRLRSSSRLAACRGSGAAACSLLTFVGFGSADQAGPLQPPGCVRERHQAQIQPPQRGDFVSDFRERKLRG